MSATVNAPETHQKRLYAAMIRAIALFAALCAATLSSESRADRYAAFVADMETGEVLHARRADAPRYPASLTKVMTLYMTFEALEAGDLALDDVLTASAEAASRPASELGLAEGDTLSVEEAIRALVVQSANDVAVVLAEHLAEDEILFAAAMTERASALGLTSTRFMNASGLPDPRQRTTARDMARLAYAMHRDFPQYWPYFAETEFAWNGRTHHNHNSLVGRVDGVDGLKTGYIRASGFNVAATAERDGRRLIAVIMGGASPAVRDAHTRELIEAGFSALSARDVSRRLASLDVPRLNPIREQELLTAELSGQLRPAAMGSAGPAAAPVQVVFEERSGSEPGLVLAAGWSIQVGAYGSRAAAMARLETVADMDMSRLLSDAEPVTAALASHGRALWRARFSGLDADQARTACAYLQANGEPCFTVAPGS
jgi:D-alanyl-D-alanine carboxypeptidase